MESGPLHKHRDVLSIAAQQWLVPVLGCWSIVLIRQLGRSLSLILVFSLGTTLLEGVAVLIGHVGYGNDWNLAWTFISCLVAYVAVYQFYMLIRHVLREVWSKYEASTRFDKQPNSKLIR